VSEQSRYYTQEEVHNIIQEARGAYRAWTTLPPRLIAVAMQRLGVALGEVETPGGNGHKQVELSELPEEATEGLTCSLSGG